VRAAAVKGVSEVRIFGSTATGRIVVYLESHQPDRELRVTKIVSD
jgi:hypothetical protein